MQSGQGIFRHPAMQPRPRSSPRSRRRRSTRCSAACTLSARTAAVMGRVTRARCALLRASPRCSRRRLLSARVGGSVPGMSLYELGHGSQPLWLFRTTCGAQSMCALTAACPSLSVIFELPCDRIVNAWLRLLFYSFGCLLSRWGNPSPSFCFLLLLH